MNNQHPRSSLNFDVLMPVAAAVLGLVLIWAWARSAGPTDLVLRIPGMDRDADQRVTSQEELAPPVAGQPIEGDGQPSTYAGEWPCFRGPQLDGIAHESPSLARNWPDDGPPVLWTVTLGEGYASPVISHGRVFVLDYDETAKADTMLCLSLDDGREIWRNSYPIEISRSHGMSRTVPTLVGDRVISFGPRCHVACWDVNTGECHWLIDLVSQYGAVVPRWYAGQCPLIDGDRLILAPCGDSLLIALDYKTGELIWKTPNTLDWEMTHASITPVNFHQKMYVYCASGGVVGISADDGKLLWSCSKWPVQFATAPSALDLTDGRMIVSSGYRSDVGALLLQLKKNGDSIDLDPPTPLTPKQFNSEQQTPILYKEHIFGIRKHGGGRIVCMDRDGKELWNSGRDRLGHGPYMIADDVILAMSNDGELFMCEATTTAYKKLASFQVFEDGQDAWGPMALAGSRLIVRDMTRMSCLDLSASPAAGSDKPSE